MNGTTSSRRVATPNDVAPASNNDGTVLIEKCCPRDELLVDNVCTPLTVPNTMNVTTAWQPEFLDEQSSGKIYKDHKYDLQFGRPICRNDEHEWYVYYYPKGEDRLAILTTGKLRHFIPESSKDLAEQIQGIVQDLQEDDVDTLESVHYDYPFGHYCIDKAILTGERLVLTYAMVCVPNVSMSWTDTSYFMRRVVDPIFRALSMACYLAIAVVYFVLPQLRDLVGNMITSMSLCLFASQSASTVRIFTEYSSHVSFMVAGEFCFFYDHL